MEQIHSTDCVNRSQSGLHTWTLQFYYFLCFVRLCEQPQILYRINVWALTGPIRNFHIVFFAPLLCSFRCVLWIVAAIYILSQT